MDTARFLGGEIVGPRPAGGEIRRPLLVRGGGVCRRRAAISISPWPFAAIGEGFTVYGEKGSVNGKMHIPWYHKTTEVECFSIG